MERLEPTTVNLPADTGGRASPHWCSSEGAARHLCGRVARDFSFGRRLASVSCRAVVPHARIGPADLLRQRPPPDSAYDIGSLADAVRAAGARATLKR